MKKILLLIGIGIVGALLVLCILGSLFGQSDKPAKPTSVPASTQTVLPIVPTVVPSTPTSVPATPPPTIDSRDVAYIDGWVEKVGPPWELMGEVAGGLGEAAGRGDIDEMCEFADAMVVVSANVLLELKDLPSPEHPYLVMHWAGHQASVGKVGAAGIAYLNFCDTGDLDELEAGTALIIESGEEMTAAMDWLNKYNEEIE